MSHGSGRLAFSLAFVLPLAAQDVSVTPAGSGRGPVARVAYVSNETRGNVFELLSVTVDGSDAPIVLSAPLPAGGVVMDFAQVFGARVLYRAEQLTDGLVELFVVPDDGSAPPVRLSGPLVVGGDVNAFLAGEEHVIYQADAVVDGRDELYSVRLDGSSPPIALAPGLDVPRLFQLSRDGRRVMFATGLGEERLHIVPADGSAPPFDLVGSGNRAAAACSRIFPRSS